uniref:Uncharacterized protein n=1 Tax=Tanacetum cinerariifolium TaxID=118510 RepID=A0A699JL69_TANCI|nr:hypothetical protein [Tanacetum cinerariifolium]
MLFITFSLRSGQSGPVLKNPTINAALAPYRMDLNLRSLPAGHQRQNEEMRSSAVNLALAVGKMELNLRRLPTERQRQNQAMRLAYQLEVGLAGYQGGGPGSVGDALGGVLCEWCS